MIESVSLYLAGVATGVALGMGFLIWRLRVNNRRYWLEIFRRALREDDSQDV